MNSKFRGTLLGVLVGDSCGAAFEGEIFDAGQRLVLKKFLDTLHAKTSSGVRNAYTDDTAMTKSVAKCLINYDAESFQKTLAVNFVKEYFNAPSRGYGAGVIDLFHNLKKSEFEDFLMPARWQFNGQGSFGNGAAMRVSPVALYCFNKSDEFLIDLVEKTSMVTHANVIGVNGAILQALAIHQNLKMDSREEIDINDYVDTLLKKFGKIETGQDEHGIPEITYYTKQLHEVKRLLNKKFVSSDEEVVNVLGHSVNALHSVPTAIYCFLRTARKSDSDATNLRKTLEYSISLGGDTDTIASMACALTGAFYGEESYLQSLVKHCEGSEEILQLADDLYAAAPK